MKGSFPSAEAVVCFLLVLFAALRLYDPLDLYLAGFLAPEVVPVLLLVDNPELVPAVFLDERYEVSSVASQSLSKRRCWRTGRGSVRRRASVSLSPVSLLDPGSTSGNFTRFSQ